MSFSFHMDKVDEVKAIIENSCTLLDGFRKDKMQKDLGKLAKSV